MNKLLFVIKAECYNFKMYYYCSICNFIDVNIVNKEYSTIFGLEQEI